MFTEMKLICLTVPYERLSPSNAQPKTDHRTTETIAGHRFLEALRQNHNDDEELESTPMVEHVQAASFAFELKKDDDASEIKKKRMTLRASLEELLVQYLRGLAPENDNKFTEHSRVARDVIESDLKSESKRIEEDEIRNLTRNISCPDRRQRITQLDRNELHDAIQNDAEDEHNIRRILNHR